MTTVTIRVAVTRMIFEPSLSLTQVLSITAERTCSVSFGIRNASCSYRSDSELYVDEFLMWFKLVNTVLFKF
jgi:hypothetical protein